MVYAKLSLANFFYSCFLHTFTCHCCFWEKAFDIKMVLGLQGSQYCLHLSFRLSTYKVNTLSDCSGLFTAWLLLFLWPLKVAQTGCEHCDCKCPQSENLEWFTKNE